jgi:CubicO group peptidase (beta-lactamase class C family)
VRSAGRYCALVLTLLPSSRNEFPPDRQLVARIRPLVQDSASTGIVLGVLEANGRRRIVSFGSGGPDTRPLGRRSLFEIGSINKTFTGILLADMANRGEVALSDPVTKYLPATVKVPSRSGREITLLDLATHRSGLPRMNDHVPADSSNPYSDFTVQELYDFLSHYELPRDIGAEYEYSNLGFGLLGHALGRAAHASYEPVLRSRILEPLGLRATTAHPTGELAAWSTKGHDAKGNLMHPWDATDAIAGAGGLRSDVDDLLVYLAANVRAGGSLGAAIRSSHIKRQNESVDQGVGLAWSIRRLGDRTVIGHAGGTGGFVSFIGFDPDRRVGVVLLANFTAGGGAVIQLGYDLLTPPSSDARPRDRP